MLLKLSIKNYILIQDLEIDFSAGFSVITGETGAGKSILLGALGLILGQRADSSILLDISKKCVIEGSFLIKGYNLEQLFKINELDFDEVIILRREINPGGKSRAFVNDTPVNVSMLKDIGDRLVNVHSQNSIVTLNDTNFQLAVLDSYAGIQSEVNSYKSGYLSLVELKRQLIDLSEIESRSLAERDYHQFLLDELNKSNLRVGELEEVEERLEFLKHAEEIKKKLFNANQLISESEGNILTQLSETIHSLNGIAQFKTEVKDIVERISVNYIDIKDISKYIADVEAKIYFESSEIETLTLRLDALYRLLKKHQKLTIEELLLIRQGLEEKVFDVYQLGEKIAALNSDITRMEAELTKTAKSVSGKRHHFVLSFEKEMVNTLLQLGISTPRFKIELKGTDGLTKDGTDKVKFLFSANKGVEINELSNTASGGEMSRLMLSIKSMISQKNLLPTIFFDEIDNGVSGEIAGKVGSILKRMGSKMQVIAITHLPQIAGKGDHHYWVYKSEKNQTTNTFIRQLSVQDRIEEIAKMLSNEIVTESAYQTAKELLNN
jgi:DNA repair protein RecN (Recombination protein N)